jgi:hypothetical protein
VRSALRTRYGARECPARVRLPSGRPATPHAVALARGDRAGPPPLAHGRAEPGPPRSCRLACRAAARRACRPASACPLLPAPAMAPERAGGAGRAGRSARAASRPACQAARSAPVRPGRVVFAAADGRNRSGSIGCGCVRARAGRSAGSLTLPSTAGSGSRSAGGGASAGRAGRLRPGRAAALAPGVVAAAAALPGRAGGELAAASGAPAHCDHLARLTLACRQRAAPARARPGRTRRTIAPRLVMACQPRAERARHRPALRPAGCGAERSPCWSAGAGRARSRCCAECGLLRAQARRRHGAGGAAQLLWSGRSRAGRAARPAAHGWREWAPGRAAAACQRGVRRATASAACAGCASGGGASCAGARGRACSAPGRPGRPDGAAPCGHGRWR